MKTISIFKILFALLLLLTVFQADAQTQIEHDGGLIKYLDKVYERLEPIESYPATLTLSINPETDKYFITVAPEKGEPYQFEFTRPTQKEKCASLMGIGKNASSGIKFKVSGLDCKIAHPRITIRDKNKEISFLLTDEGNQQAVSELKKIWVKK